MKKILLLTLFIAYNFLALAQKYNNPFVDSLVVELPKAKEDTNKVNMLLDISFDIFAVNPDDAISYAAQGIELSEKLNFKKGIASGYRYMGMGYMTKSMFPKALDCYLKALKIFEGLGDKMAVAKTQMSIALVYTNELDFDKAFKFYSSALATFEEQGNKNAIGKVYNNLGILFQKQKKYDKAIEYYTKSNAVKENSGDKLGLESNLSNMAAIYFDQKQFDLALDNYNKALALNDITGNKNYRGTHISGMGNTYLSIAEEDRTDLLQKYFGGNKKAAYQKAKNYLDEAIKIYIELGDLHDLHPFYKALSNTQEELGDLKGALDSYKKYVAGKDTLFNKENSKKLIEMQLQFDYEKKEREAKAEQDKKDLLVQQEIQKQKFIIGFVVLGLFFVLILAGFIFRSLRIRNKQNKIISQQKTEAEHQRQVVEEKQREILDSIRYAKRIQKSLLPTETYLDRNIKRLQKKG